MNPAKNIDEDQFQHVGTLGYSMFAVKQRCMNEATASSKVSRPLMNTDFSSAMSKTAFLKRLLFVIVQVSLKFVALHQKCKIDNHKGNKTQRDYLMRCLIKFLV